MVRMTFRDRTTGGDGACVLRPARKWASGTSSSRLSSLFPPTPRWTVPEFLDSPLFSGQTIQANDLRTLLKRGLAWTDESTGGTSSAASNFDGVGSFTFVRLLDTILLTYFNLRRYIFILVKLRAFRPRRNRD